MYNILTWESVWARVACAPWTATWTAKRPSGRTFPPVRSCSSAFAVTGERWTIARQWRPTRCRRLALPTKRCYRWLVTTSTAYRYRWPMRWCRCRPASGTSGTDSWASAPVRGCRRTSRWYPGRPRPPRRTGTDRRRPPASQPGAERWSNYYRWRTSSSSSYYPPDRPRLWTHDPTVRACPTTGPGCCRPVPCRCPPTASTARSCTPWCPRPAWRSARPIRRLSTDRRPIPSGPLRRYTSRLCVADRTPVDRYRGPFCLWCHHRSAYIICKIIITIELHNNNNSHNKSNKNRGKNDWDENWNSKIQRYIIFCKML